MTRDDAYQQLSTYAASIGLTGTAPDQYASDASNNVASGVWDIPTAKGWIHDNAIQYGQIADDGRRGPVGTPEIDFPPINPTDPVVSVPPINTGNAGTTNVVPITPAIVPAPHPAPAATASAIPIVGPIVNHLAASIGISPMIVWIGGGLVAAWAFGLFDEGGRR